MAVLLNVTLRTGIKFRTQANGCKIRAEFDQSAEIAPSHVTICNWTLKIGYYELTRKRIKSDGWIIILDHSIQFGKEKIFVVMGILESDYLKLSRPLQYTDLTPLSIKPAKNWNGTLVCSVINTLNDKYGTIKYAVGDYGSDLKKGLRLSGIPHIHDLSHLMALQLKNVFAKDERYIALKSEMSAMRTKFIQTDIASAVPPKGRTKSEYHSLDTLIKWAEGSLRIVAAPSAGSEKDISLHEMFPGGTVARIQTALAWITGYKELVSELSEINRAVKEIEKSMKHRSLSLATIQEAATSLSKLQSPKGLTFRAGVMDELQAQFDLLADTDTILFSSDILESTFGKYKNRLSENPMASVTNLMLIIAAFTRTITEESVRECMQSVKMSDIKKWSDSEIGTSLYKQRKLLYSS
jgi:hypothetical protein